MLCQYVASIDMTIPLRSSSPRPVRGQGFEIEVQLVSSDDSDDHAIGTLPVDKAAFTFEVQLISSVDSDDPAIGTPPVDKAALTFKIRPL